MKRLIPFLFLFLVFDALGGEITDQYWSGNNLFVTYYQTQAPSRRIICTAFTQDGKAVAGDEKYSTGYVAKLVLSVRNKFAGTDLKVVCN